MGGTTADSTVAIPVLLAPQLEIGNGVWRGGCFLLLLLLLLFPCSCRMESIGGGCIWNIRINPFFFFFLSSFFYFFIYWGIDGK